jgi:hypothetical protein
LDADFQLFWILGWATAGAVAGVSWCVLSSSFADFSA